MDKDSTFPSVTDTDNDKSENPSLVFNLTVTLKDSKPKVEGAPSKSRKEEQAKALADKLVSTLHYSLLLFFALLYLTVLHSAFLNYSTLPPLPFFILLFSSFLFFVSTPSIAAFPIRRHV